MGNMGGTHNSEPLCLDRDSGRMWPGLWWPHPAHTLALPSLWVNHHPLVFLRAGMQVPMNIAFETNKSVLPYLPLLAQSIFVSRFSILEIWGFCLLFLWKTSKCLGQVFNKTKISNSYIPAPEFWTSPTSVLLIDHYAVLLQRCLTFWIKCKQLGLALKPSLTLLYPYLLTPFLHIIYKLLKLHYKLCMCIFLLAHRTSSCHVLFLIYGQD